MTAAAERRKVTTREAGERRPARGAATARALAALAVLAWLPACEGATDPPLASGTLEFEMLAEGSAAPETWSATGSCGDPGFTLGSTTCAVGSVERNYVAALGVRRHDDGSLGLVVVAHPGTEGTCQASASTAARCGMFFEPARPAGSAEPGPYYLLASGTVTIAIVEDGGTERLTGTFEGWAEDPEGVLPDLEITGGTFDVELVR